MLFSGISKMFSAQISRSYTNKQKDGSKTSSWVTVLVLILNVRLGGGSEDSQTVINQHWQQHARGTNNFSLPTLTRKAATTAFLWKTATVDTTNDQGYDSLTKILKKDPNKCSSQNGRETNNFQVAILFTKRIANQVCPMLTTSHHVRYVAFNFICNNKYLGRT